MVNDVCFLQFNCDSGESVEFLGFDISDAFNNVPVAQSERKYLCAHIGGKFIVFDSLVFGSGSSPTIWGRYAALLGRSLASIFCPTELRLQIYVDDPILSARGDVATRRRLFTIALLWVAATGFPVAWHKAEAGTAVRWIGAQLNIHADGLKVCIPPDMIADLLQRTNDLLSVTTVSRRRVRSYCGSLSFVAGLVCFLRPFLSAIWAALSKKADSANDADACQVPTRKRKRRLPLSMLFTRQFQHSLHWLLAFLTFSIGPLERNFLFAPASAGQRLRIATDASPWGVGGVLVIDNVISAWFAHWITHEDLRRFNAKRGVSDFNTLWEALAILIAVRLWRRASHVVAQIEVRSDSLGSLRMLNKLSSPDPSLNVIARELALDSARLLREPDFFVHTPGVANVLPDKLSRLWAPKPSVFPSVLNGIPGGQPPERDSAFWLTTGAPVGSSLA